MSSPSPIAKKTGLRTRCRRFLARVRRDVRGNVAMIFGLALIPIITAGGTALDLSRAMVAKSRLSNALDAAGLAVGASVGASNVQMLDIAQKYFNANYPDDEIGVASGLQLTVVGTTMTLSASAQIETTLLNLVGINYITVATSSTIVRESKGLEVVLVADNTGSMNDGGKIGSLRQAATDLVNILFGDLATPEKLRMGIVPFSQTVRLNVTTAVSGGWIDTTGTSSVARLNFNGGYHGYTTYPRMSSQVWRGCVEARPGGLEELDTAPNASVPNTRWVAYFLPDEPDNNDAAGQVRYPNTYISDGLSLSTAPLTRQINNAKYVNRNSTGPHRGCGLQELLPLTNVKATILAKITALNADGYTHIPIGLAWGWRVLSPTQPFNQGSAYNDPDWNKALILLTDGLNTIDSRNNMNLSTYSAWGYLSQRRMGSTITTAAQTVTEQNAQTGRICQRIKDQGVRVYTILFMITDTTLANLFRTCASEPSLYFNSPTTTELQTVFRTIAQDLSNLRISQ